MNLHLPVRMSKESQSPNKPFFNEAAFDMTGSGHGYIKKVGHLSLPL